MSDRCRSSIVAVLGLVAVLLLLPSVAPAGPDPNCLGSNACTNNTGIIGEGACMGTDSCRNNSGDIRKRACQGDPVFGGGVCENNEGIIGESACQERIACTGNHGTIGNGACIGFSACTANTFWDRMPAAEHSRATSTSQSRRTAVSAPGPAPPITAPWERTPAPAVGVLAQRGRSARAPVRARRPASTMASVGKLLSRRGSVQGHEGTIKDACRGEEACRPPGGDQQNSASATKPARARVRATSAGLLPRCWGLPEQPWPHRAEYL
jgi:hypothetical protein